MTASHKEILARFVQSWDLTSDQPCKALNYAPVADPHWCTGSYEELLAECFRVTFTHKYSYQRPATNMQTIMLLILGGWWLSKLLRLLSYVLSYQWHGFLIWLVEHNRADVSSSHWTSIFWKCLLIPNSFQGRLTESFYVTNYLAHHFTKCES